MSSPASTKYLQVRRDSFNTLIAEIGALETFLKEERPLDFAKCVGGVLDRFRVFLEEYPEMRKDDEASDLYNDLIADIHTFMLSAEIMDEPMPNPSLLGHWYNNEEENDGETEEVCSGDHRRDRKRPSPLSKD